jgi:hypothetical protein
MTLTSGGNLLVGTTTDAGFRLDVNGTGRFGGIITTTSSGIASGNFGGNAASWEGNSGYPTLFGSSADRWIMHINPHISYTQNGVNGFTGSMTGATLRYASNPAAASYWDIGVGTNSVGADKMSLGRAGVNFLAITNAGNIGIGTATPAMSLQIGNGSLTGNQYLRLFNSASDIYLGQTGSNLFGAGNGQVLVSDATYTSNFAIGTLNGSANLIFGTANTIRLTISNTGAAIFNNGSNQSTIISTTFAGIEYTRGATLFGFVGTENSGSGGMRYNSIAGNFEHNFYTNGSLSVKINSSGNVGIGTTLPFSRLHVTNSDTLTGTIAIGNSQYPGLIYSSASSGEFRIDNRSSAGAGYITFFPNGQENTLGNEAMRIATSRNVLIGTTTDIGQRLQVSGGYIAQVDAGVRTFLGYDGTGSLIGTTTNHYLRFITNDTERMRITSSGNVGINSSSGFNQISSVETTLKIANSNAASLYLEVTGVRGYANFVGPGGNMVWYDYTAGADRMTMFTNGNLRVGTGPDSGGRFQVNGSILIGNLSSGSDAIINLATNASGGPRSIIYRAATAFVDFTNTAGTAVFQLSNGGAATFSSDVTAARYYNPSGPYGTSQANARNHFTQFNAGNAGLAGGWISGAFGDALGNRIVIGQYAGVAVIAGHNGNLDNWASMALATGGGNVMIGTTTDVGAKLYVEGAIRTGAPSGGSAVNWKLGTARGGPVTSNATVRVEIDGVLVDLVARYV